MVQNWLCEHGPSQSLHLPGPQFPPEDERIGPEVSSILFSPVLVQLSDDGRRSRKGKIHNLEPSNQTITYLCLQSHTAQLPPSGCVKANQRGEEMREGALMCREEAWGDFEKRAGGSVLRVLAKKVNPRVVVLGRGNAGVLQEKPRA